jgi:hypothetical protein
MALDDAGLKRLVTDLLTTKSERTKQRKIGASSIGNPCPYCLAHALIGTEQRQGKYWLGAKIGDAIHKLLETEASKHVDKPENYRFNALKNARLEEKVFIGNIPGYGDVFSTPDLYLSTENHLVDYKTSKRIKVEQYRLSGKLPIKYLYQVQLYARALIRAGYPVDKISFVFINRDGTGERDVVVFSVDYDEKLADKAWDRVVSAWKWLEAGGDPEILPSDPDCYVCDQVLHRMGP